MILLHALGLVHFKCHELFLHLPLSIYQLLHLLKLHLQVIAHRRRLQCLIACRRRVRLRRCLMCSSLLPYNIWSSPAMISRSDYFSIAFVLRLIQIYHCFNFKIFSQVVSVWVHSYCRFKDNFNVQNFKINLEIQIF